VAAPSVTPAVTKLILAHFPHTPTDGQREVCVAMSQFLFDGDARSAFLLRGYAGTGKTSLVSALIAVLPQLRVNCVLLAPTGRAAKVISGYAHRPAYTIHKKIYMTATDATGQMRTVRAVNKHSYTLFIVDEASMIGLEPTGSRQSLLEDLVEYVYSGNHCRLMLIGDTAQLPPVGQSESPALDNRYLAASFGLNVIMQELTEVVRQQSLSGILANATALRGQIATIGTDEAQLPLFTTADDVVNLNGQDLMEVLNNEYSGDGLENVVVVTRSNKRANLFNQGIRSSVLFREGEVNAGDYLMVVKNNYFWLSDEEKETTPFIANGDIAEIIDIDNYETLYGFDFANVTVRFSDYNNFEITLKVLLNTLSSESPSLSYEENNKLYTEVSHDYAEIKNKRKLYEEIKKNPYFNALQIKFAYAITCHKAQGGQWKHVYIDHGFFNKDNVDQEFIRWLYTACTRATEKIYFVNFKDDFFE
jgi:exodeoxyribonuclease-5